MRRRFHPAQRKPVDSRMSLDSWCTTVTAASRTLRRRRPIRSQYCRSSFVDDDNLEIIKRLATTDSNAVLTKPKVRGDIETRGDRCRITFACLRWWTFRTPALLRERPHPREVRGDQACRGGRKVQRALKNRLQARVHAGPEVTTLPLVPGIDEYHPLIALMANPSLVQSLLEPISEQFRRRTDKGSPVACWRGVLSQQGTNVRNTLKSRRIVSSCATKAQIEYHAAESRVREGHSLSMRSAMCPCGGNSTAPSKPTVEAFPCQVVIAATA